MQYRVPPFEAGRLRGDPRPGAISGPGHYASALLLLDEEIGRLFTYLRDRQLWDPVIVVLAGVHGEALGELEETGHGVFLNEATVRVPLLVAGIVLNGAATGLYIAASFGPGPRDGLMTGLHRRTGRSLRLMRTAVEVTVVVTGFALGGTIGVGTLLYALSIGPLAQLFLRVFAVPAAPDGSKVVAEGTPGRAILPS